MIISLTGKPGAGKSSCAKILTERLKLKRYYMGAILRDLAKQHNMHLNQYLKHCETDPKADHEVDDYQTNLGKTEDNFVIEGRTSFHFIPHSIKIYLDCDLDMSAKRIHKDVHDKDVGTTRNEKKYESIEDAKESLQKIIDGNRQRYKQYYGIDSEDMGNFDIVIDTTKQTPEETVEEILQKIEALEQSDKN